VGLPEGGSWRTALWTDLGIDAGIAVVTGSITAVMISVADEPNSQPVDAGAYVLGVVMTLPVLMRRRRPLATLLVTSLVLLVYYSVGYPGIPPTVVLAVPLYTAVLAGRMTWAVVIAAMFLTAGFFVLTVRKSQAPVEVFATFLPHVALAAAVILLGEVVRGRRALAAETRDRLRRAEQEREQETARKVAEERVRIARELHDTVAHSMATITVQAGSALHVLQRSPDDRRPNDVGTALAAIRDTSKQALQEMRATLGLLRGKPGSEPEGPETAAAGLDRLPALVDAVRAAGVPVALTVAGRAVPLSRQHDHCAYRILQESLTNVLRHAGPGVRATVRVTYDPTGIALEIADDGCGLVGTPGEKSDEQREAGGHGLDGMRERAESVGGILTAGPHPNGGFVVSARLPVEAE
jgi:signal transduction histidine kinase